MLKSIVKLSQVTNLSDARYAAGMGVSLIGFNIDPDSENYLAPEKCREISKWVAGIEFVAESGASSLATINDEIFSYVESSNWNSLNSPFKKILRTNAITPDDFGIERFNQKEINPDFIIIEASPASLYEYADSLAKITDVQKVLIASNFNLLLVDFVLDTIQPYGIEIKGTPEDQPGFKDYEIAAILEHLSDD